MGPQQTSSFFYFVIVYIYICIIQTPFTIAFPLSNLQHNLNSNSNSNSNSNFTLPLNANETQLFKRDAEGVKVYTVKTFFLIDQTPKSQEEAEKQKLAEILKSINQKLRNEGSFDEFYIQLEAAKVNFQETLYLNKPTLLPVARKWNKEYPEKYGSEPVHAAMLLTRINNFKYMPPTNRHPIAVRLRRQMALQEHLRMQQRYPSLFIKTNDPQVMAPVHHPSYPMDEGIDEAHLPPGFFPLGSTDPFTICNRKATGVMTGWGDDSHRHTFESVFIHEFFHGFGIIHDPEFLPKCQGFLMEDGISGDPPVKFSPCSKAAMKIILQRPGLECLKEPGSNANALSNENKEMKEVENPKNKGSIDGSSTFSSKNVGNPANGLQGGNGVQGKPPSMSSNEKMTTMSKDETPVVRKARSSEPSINPTQQAASSSFPRQWTGQPGLSGLFPQTNPGFRPFPPTSSYSQMNGGFGGHQAGGFPMYPGLGGGAGSPSTSYPMGGNGGMSPMYPQSSSGFGVPGMASHPSMFGSSGGFFPPASPYPQAGSGYGSQFGAGGFGSPFGGSPFSASGYGSPFGGGGYGSPFDGSHVGGGGYGSPFGGSHFGGSGFGYQFGGSPFGAGAPGGGFVGQGRYPGFGF